MFICANCPLVPLTRREKPIENRRRRFPFLDFALELLPPGLRQRVVPRTAVVLRETPLGADVALLFELEQGRVQRAVIEREHLAARLLDAARDAVAVHLTHG